jgi:hypothetical protein
MLSRSTSRTRLRPSVSVKEIVRQSGSSVKGSFRGCGFGPKPGATRARCHSKPLTSSVSIVPQGMSIGSAGGTLTCRPLSIRTSTRYPVNVTSPS